MLHSAWYTTKLPTPQPQAATRLGGTRAVVLIPMLLGEVVQAEVQAEVQESAHKSPQPMPPAANTNEPTLSCAIHICTGTQPRRTSRPTRCAGSTFTSPTAIGCVATHSTHVRPHSPGLCQHIISGIHANAIRASSDAAIPTHSSHNLWRLQRDAQQRHLRTVGHRRGEACCGHKRCRYALRTTLTTDAGTPSGLMFALGAVADPHTRKVPMRHVPHHLLKELRSPLALSSAYKNVLGAEPEVTCATSRFEGTLDYVWFTRAVKPAAAPDTHPRTRLRAVRCQQLPTRQFARNSNGLPNAVWPSDHLALGCVFALG